MIKLSLFLTTIYSIHLTFWEFSIFSVLFQLKSVTQANFSSTFSTYWWRSFKKIWANRTSTWLCLIWPTSRSTWKLQTTKFQLQLSLQLTSSNRRPSRAAPRLRIWVFHRLLRSIKKAFLTAAILWLRLRFLPLLLRLDRFCLEAVFRLRGLISNHR